MNDHLIWTIPHPKYITIALVAFLSSFNCICTNTDNADAISRLLSVHFPVLVSQNILLILITIQILSIRTAFPLIAIRDKTSYMQLNLLKLVLAQTILYMICFYTPFFCSSAPAFKDGSPLIGALVLFGRFGLLCVLAIILVGMFHTKRPYYLLMTAIILNLVYHYMIESKFLFIQYSPIYDPIYRIMHLTEITV